MILSRAKPAIQGSASNGGAGDEGPQGGGTAVHRGPMAAAARKSAVPTLEEFLKERDYSGAICLLEFQRSSSSAGRKDVKVGGGGGGKDVDALVNLWLAYCSFHSGDYKRAMLEYEALKESWAMEGQKQPPEFRKLLVNLACCYFYLGMYKESEKHVASSKASASSSGTVGKDGGSGGGELGRSEVQLRNRLQFHLAHKFGDEKRLMTFHQELEDVVEDQLCLASIHYLRSHYQEAIDIYKRILLDNREYLALNVYVALCYYKLDYYDVSQEVLAVYLQHHPSSVIAVNLKACNHFRLYNGKAAEQELKALQQQDHHQHAAASAGGGGGGGGFGTDLLRHNLVVFRSGEGALQVLPPLVDVVPEARLNLVIHFLRQGDVNEAYSLIKDLEPTVPQEYILKGVVNAALGQESGSREHLKVAQQYFQLVGGSASECDTIPGRQCMAACFFLLKQFEDVLLYLNSIKSYFYNDDTFNFNYGQAKAAVGSYAEAEEVLLQIQNEKLLNDFAYLSWLARCCIMNGKPRIAWELYLKMETSGESFSLLQLIANDCYKMGQFFYSAKAFDMLERLDPNPEYWEGKRGAAIGHFQMVIAGKEERQSLGDIVQILKNTSNPQTEHIIKVMKKWAKENRLQL